jgi:tetratricopeptide (TPR) repeat protein
MGKITTITILILLGVSCLAFAQKDERKRTEKTAVPSSSESSPKQSSPKESYEKYKDRPSKQESKKLLQKAEELKDDKPSEALDNVEEALGVSLANEDQFNEGKSYILLAEINEKIKEWKLAIENYQLAYEKLFTDYRNTEEFRKTLQGLGSMSVKLKDYPKAITYYNEALALPVPPSSTTYQKTILLDISEAFYQAENYSEALAQVERITIDNTDAAFEFRVQNQKAKIYAKMNELDKTRALFSNSINSIPAGSTVPPEQAQNLQITKEEIAGVLRSQKRYDEEITLRNQAVQFHYSTSNFAEVSKDKVEIGNVLAAKGENLAAIREIEEAARIADTLNDPKEQANAFLALADVYEKSGRANQALHAYKKYSRAVTKAEAANEDVLLEKSNLIKKQRDIEEVLKDVSIGQREETIAMATVARQQLVIYGLLFLILVVLVTSYFIYKNAIASKIANQLLALKSLRSQMNPHFIFNALNSVNHFIAQQDERTANKFLSEFSQLMRLVLENSQQDFISLVKEQEILGLYLKLEHYRFRDKFDYEIKVDDNINSETIEVPPMLIQPYIENAVWHGLRYKDEKGKLVLHFKREAENLVVEISDNGIGRKKSAELKTVNQKKHNSTGLKNIQQRLQIINKVYHSNYRVVIEDLTHESGTRVRIYLPINNRVTEEAA